MTVPRPWCETASLWRRLRKSGLRARSTIRAFPSPLSSIVCAKPGPRLDEIDYVVFYDKPFLKFERLLETYLSFAPSGFNSFRTAMPFWLREKLFQKDLLRKDLLQACARLRRQTPNCALANTT